MEVEVGGQKFSLKKIDPFKQFHLVRRMAPILNEIIPVMGSIAKNQKSMEQMSESEKLEKMAEFGKPVIDGFSRLSDADADYCLYSLLGCVQVKDQSGVWANLIGPNNTMMYPFDLPMILQIAGKAFSFNLSGFFGALPKSSS